MPLKIIDSEDFVYNNAALQEQLSASGRALLSSVRLPFEVGL